MQRASGGVATLGVETAWAGAQPAKVSSASAWVLHPIVDVAFVICALWPLVAAGNGLLGSRADFSFVWLFFSTSHRWATLPLVAFEWQAARERRSVVVFGCALMAALYGSLWLLTGFTGLAIAVYVFDVWHRSAQHYGIARLYERRSPDRPALPRTAVLLRALSLYAMIRALGFVPLYGVGAHFPMLRDPALAWIDLPVAALAGYLVVVEIGAGRAHTPRGAYVVSASILYGCLLVATAARWEAWIAAFVLAGLFFHSTEYLAVVSWRTKRQQGGAHGWRALLATRWYTFLAGLMLVLGAIGWLLPLELWRGWALLNFFVSLLHYQLDGIVWRGAYTKLVAPRAAQPR